VNDSACHLTDMHEKTACSCHGNLALNPSPAFDIARQVAATVHRQRGSSAGLTRFLMLRNESSWHGLQHCVSSVTSAQQIRMTAVASPSHSLRALLFRLHAGLFLHVLLCPSRWFFKLFSLIFPTMQCFHLVLGIPLVLMI